MLTTAPRTRESVAVLHGLGGHWLVMEPLSRRLRSRGYQVANWGYRSFWKTIQLHARNFRPTLERFEEEPDLDRYHIVAHSMGSVIVRAVLQEFRPRKLGRIVFVCPPNSGSHVASTFAPWFGWASTTLTQITKEPNSYVNRLPASVPKDVEVGIIQAERDLIVDLDATRLDGVDEYILLPGFHSSILFRSQTAESIDHFLQQGTFGSLESESRG